MQQTEKYKLNLIEREDTFSPEALNENMEKVEAQFDAVRAEASAGVAAEAQTRADADATLDQRVQVLELHHFACGSYTGNSEGYGSTQFIELGFTPAAVLIPGVHQNLGILGIALTDNPYQGVIEIQPGGFMVSAGPSGSYHNANSKGQPFRYLAFC